MITSTSNAKVAGVRRLAKHGVRRETGRFVVEGYRELRRALAAGVAMDHVLFCPELFLKDGEARLVERARLRSIAALEVSEQVFRSVSYRDRPDGLLAVARTWDASLAALGPLEGDPLVLVVSAIEKPGNLGTMLRTAAAAGASAVIVADPVTDVFNPNVVRASLGALFTVPLASAGDEQAIDWLGERDLPVYATSPDASRRYWEAPLAGPCAIVVGSEQFGLSERWLAAANDRLRIPMSSNRGADSLNAAAAAAVVLFECVRQRAGAG